MGWLMILGSIVVIVALVILWFNFKLLANMKKNTFKTPSGKVITIPYNGNPLIETVKALLKFFDGSFRGEKAIETFLGGVKKAVEKNPDLHFMQGSFLHLHSITVWDPEYARLVLFAKDSELCKGSLGATITDNFLGESILLANGDKWKEHKTVLSPAFAWKHVQSILPAFVDIAKNLQSKWNGKSQSFLISEWLEKATLDAIGRGGFGFDFKALDEGSESKEIKQYRSLMKEFQNPIHFFDRIDKLLGSRKKLNYEVSEFESFMQNLIGSKRSMIQEAGDSWKPEDILDYLLSAEQNNNLSDRQIAHDMNTFFIAGHETTAGALASILHCLAKHPEVQDKAREEIKSICGNNNPTYDDIKQMNFMENCIKETLRLFPPALAVSRVVAKELDIGDLHVTKGSLVVVLSMYMHRSEEYWGKDAEEFKPERFEDRDSIPRYAYIPFSIGPRQCIGNNFALLEMKTFLSVLLQNFSFSIDTNSTEKPVPYMGSVLTINPKCPLIVTPV
mmetsp:Transcript_12576/g.26630  ORF Transcript_12576/g.26630 Transcript_12576/m.26630 type:complete len:505 (+) Transcript_12576:79-1593(+)